MFILLLYTNKNSMFIFPLIFNKNTVFTPKPFFLSIHSPLSPSKSFKNDKDTLGFVSSIFDIFCGFLSSSYRCNNVFSEKETNQSSGLIAGAYVFNLIKFEPKAYCFSGTY